MSQSDTTEPVQPARSYGYCSWCKSHRDGVRLVQLEDAGSGFGARGVSACTPCRGIHRLTPVAEQS